MLRLAVAAIGAVVATNLWLLIGAEAAIAGIALALMGYLVGINDVSRREQTALLAEFVRKTHEKR